MKKLRLILSWLALAALGGCSGASDDPEPTPYTSVAITHVSPDCPGLHISIDDVSLGQTALLYKDYTGYFFLEPGLTNFKFNSAVSGALLINSSLTFEQFKAYSVFLTTVGTNTYESWVVEDVGTLSSLEKCMARFAHFSPDGPRVALSIVQTGLTFPTKAYREITEFTEMEPKPYTLELRAEGTGQLILSKPFSPLAGSFYTISLVGFQTPPLNNPNQLDLLIVKSQQ